FRYGGRFPGARPEPVVSGVVLVPQEALIGSYDSASLCNERQSRQLHSPPSLHTTISCQSSILRIIHLVSKAFSTYRCAMPSLERLMRVYFFALNNCCNVFVYSACSNLCIRSSVASRLPSTTSTAPCEIIFPVSIPAST